MELREYQEHAVSSVLAAWDGGVRRVLCVAPTGAGKTVIGVEIARHLPTVRVLWVAHRRELIAQAERRLQDSGLWALRHPADASVVVASVDTLHARGAEAAPRAGAVIWDEAHHCAADTYSAVLSWYPDARVVGLTATPQRGDGRPLGGQYDEMVVATTYSRLLREGSLVQCRVLRPDEPQGSDLAHDPLAAWQRWGEGRPTFAYAASVADSRRYAEAFRAAGIAAAHVDGDTPARERDAAVASFSAGKLAVLWNVHVLTEGVDVPHASCVLLARGTQAAATYLQMVGRVLRPAPGKRDALLIDLPGISHVHGLPTADREYSLDGRPIRVVGESLTVCQQCGMCYETARRGCPSCGWQRPAEERRSPRIHSLELREAAAAAGGIEHVGDAARAREWERLRRLADSRDWAPGWAVRQYRALFGEPPPPWTPTRLERERERRKLEEIARQRGYRRGWVHHRLSSLGSASIGGPRE